MLNNMLGWSVAYKKIVPALRVVFLEQTMPGLRIAELAAYIDDLENGRIELTSERSTNEAEATLFFELFSLSASRLV